MNRRRQRGFALITALIMLLLLTVLVTSSFTMSRVNLDVVGNQQWRNEALAAADNALEQVIQSMASTTPTAQSIGVDINRDGSDDYEVAVAQPQCIRVSLATAVAPSSLTLKACPARPEHRMGTARQRAGSRNRRLGKGALGHPPTAGRCSQEPAVPLKSAPRGKRMKTYLSRMLLVLSASLAHKVFAEDIDLFVGVPSSSTGAPNVLIILDNTANWNDAFANEMAALRSVVNALPEDKFRLGIMMFTETGVEIRGRTVRTRAALRPMDAANKTAMANLVTSFDKVGDKSNGGKISKAMQEAYLYFAGATPTLATTRPRPTSPATAAYRLLPMLSTPCRTMRWRAKAPPATAHLSSPAAARTTSFTSAMARRRTTARISPRPPPPSLALAAPPPRFRSPQRLAGQRR